MIKEPNVRLCRLKKWPDYPGFGVHLVKAHNDRGIVIGEVEPSSPAASCGLLDGDKVVEINGRKVDNEKFMNILRFLQSELNKDVIELLVVDRENASLQVDRSYAYIQQKDTTAPNSGMARNQISDEAAVMASLVGREGGEPWNAVVDNVIDNLTIIKPTPAEDRITSAAELDSEFVHALETKLNTDHSSSSARASNWYEGDKELEKMMEPAKNRTYRANAVIIEKRDSSQGLGMTLSLDPDVGHVITEVAPNSPAARADIRRGDSILQIEEDVVLHLSYKELAQKLAQAPQKFVMSVAPKDVILKCAVEHIPILTQYDKSSSSADVFQKNRDKFQPSHTVTSYPQQPRPDDNRYGVAGKQQVPPPPTGQYSQGKPSVVAPSSFPYQQTFAPKEATNKVTTQDIPKSTLSQFQQTGPNVQFDQRPKQVQNLQKEPARFEGTPSLNDRKMSSEHQMQQRPGYDGVQQMGTQPSPQQPIYDLKRADKPISVEQLDDSNIESKRPLSGQVGRESKPFTASDVDKKSEIVEPSSSSTKQTTVPRIRSTMDDGSKLEIDRDVSTHGSSVDSISQKRPTLPPPEHPPKGLLLEEDEAKNELDEEDEEQQQQQVKLVIVDSRCVDGTNGFRIPSATFGRHIVASVNPESPAYEGGLRRGDRVLEVNGDDCTIVGHAELKNKIESAFRSGSLELVIGRRQPSQRRVVHRTEKGVSRDIRRVFIKRMNEPSLGFELKTLEMNKFPQKIHAFGNIQKDSPAGLAGVEEGDVLVSVNYNTVSGKEHQEVLQLLREHVNDLDIELERIPEVKEIFHKGLAGDQDSPHQQGDQHRRLSSGMQPQQEEEGLIRTKLIVPKEAESLGLRVTPQLIIHHVSPGSPAEMAGLEVNDVLVELNGTHVTSDAYTVAFAILKEGFANRELDIVVSRKSGAVVARSSSSASAQSFTNQRRLEDDEHSAPDPVIRPQVTFEQRESSNVSEIRESTLGLQGTRKCFFTNLRKGKPIGLTLKENNNKPHVVSKIVQGSPAEASGLQIHDLILKVNGEDVARAPFNDVKFKISQSVPTGQLELEVLATELFPDEQKAQENLTSESTASSEQNSKNEQNAASELEKSNVKTQNTNKSSDEQHSKQSKFHQFTRRLSSVAKKKGYKRCIIPEPNDSSIGCRIAGVTGLEGLCYVSNVENDSNANLAGIEEGDKVVDVNGHSIKSMQFNQIADLLINEREKGGQIVIGLITHDELQDDEKYGNATWTDSIRRKALKRASFKSISPRVDLEKDI